MQSSQLSTDSAQSSNALLEILSRRPRQSQDDSQGPSDFQKHLDDVRSPAHPPSATKSRPANKSDKSAPSRESDSAPTDSAAPDGKHSQPTDSNNTPANESMTPTGEPAAAVISSAQASLLQPVVSPVINGPQQSTTSQGKVSGETSDSSAQTQPVAQTPNCPIAPQVPNLHPDRKLDGPSRAAAARAHPIPAATPTNPKVNFASADAIPEDELPPTPDAGLKPPVVPLGASNGEPKSQPLTSAVQDPTPRGPVNPADDSILNQAIKKEARKTSSGPLAARNDKILSTPAAVSVADKNASGPVSVNNETSQIFPAPTIRIANASGDSTAATVGRWLLAPKTDKQDSASTTPSPNPDVTTITQGPVTTTASIAPHAISTSDHASPIAARVAALLTTDNTSVDNIDAVARSLTSATAAGRHQVTLQLDPPELGRLRLDIRMEEGAMNLRVDAQAASAAKLIESRIPELREALAVHGIRIDRTDIVVRSPESGQSPAQQDQSQQNSQHGFAQHGANSDSNNRGWFSDTDANTGGDQSTWRNAHSDTPAIAAAAAASIAHDSAPDSNWAPLSLNLFA